MSLLNYLHAASASVSANRLAVQRSLGCLLAAVSFIAAPAALGQTKTKAIAAPLAAAPSETMALPTVRTTLTVTVSPATFTAGQPTLINWEARNAASLSFSCTADGTGYRASGSLPMSGSTAGVAKAEWVGYPSTCVWTAEDGEGGEIPVTVTKVLTTVADTAPPGVNGAQFISMTPPPSTLTVGQAYSYSVTVKNTGTTTWDPSTTQPYRIGAINPVDNTNWGSNRLYFDRPVAPQETRTVGLSAVVPANMPAGANNFQWQMIQEGIEWFGPASAIHVVTVTKPPVDPRVTYIHTDALGSPVATTNSNGEILTRTRYEPYGGTAAGAVPKIGFTGHVNDAETGLVYMQQRYYDPVAGRFLSIDPVTTDASTGGSFGRYHYAKNNPYVYIDPDGRSAVAIETTCIPGCPTYVADGGGSPSMPIGSSETQNAPSLASGSGPGFWESAWDDTVAAWKQPITFQRVIDGAQAIPGEGAIAGGLGKAGLILGIAKGGNASVSRALSGPIFKTTKEAVAAAEALGFKRISATIKNQAIFQKGKVFITRDIDGHRAGGAWKVAGSVKDLGHISTRTGTYDVTLTFKVAD